MAGVIPSLDLTSLLNWTRLSALSLPSPGHFRTPCSHMQITSIETNITHTRPANWILGKPTAIDLTVVLPLNPTTIIEARATNMSPALASKEGSLKPMIISVLTLALCSGDIWLLGCRSPGSSCLAIQLICSKSKTNTSIYQLEHCFLSPYLWECGRVRACYIM